MKLRSKIRAIFIVTLLVWANPSIESLILGSVPIIIGQIIHFISAGYLIKQEKLITAGPYSFVRNPFYVGSFLVDAGLCLVTRNIYVAAVYLPIFYLLVINWRVGKEEKALKTLFGARYDEYRRLVPRIIPRLWPARLAEPFGKFDWNLILKYREEWRLLRIFGLIAYFYLRTTTVFNLSDMPATVNALLKPPHLPLAITLLFVLFFPPIYEFILNPLWKTIRK
jgi:hypothetical protein